MDYIALGNRIREIRVSKKLTQIKVAEMAGIESSNLSHIERAATKVSLPTLINIANALEVSLDELVYGSLIKNEHIYKTAPRLYFRRTTRNNRNHKISKNCYKKEKIGRFKTAFDIR